MAVLLNYRSRLRQFGTHLQRVGSPDRGRGRSRTYRQLTIEVLGLDPSSTEARVAVDGLISLLRGLALGAVLRPHSDADRAALTAWLGSFQRSPT